MKILCFSRIHNCQFVATSDVSGGRLMKLNDDIITSYSSPVDLYLSGAVAGQSAVVPVVVMPASVSPTSGVVYLCPAPAATYLQWVPPATTIAAAAAAAAGSAVPAGGDVLGAWPQLNQTVAALHLNDVPDWTTTSSMPSARPLSDLYRQSTSSTSISSRCLVPSQTIAVPPSVHDAVNFTDQPADNPLVVSTKSATLTAF